MATTVTITTSEINHLIPDSFFEQGTIDSRFGAYAGTYNLTINQNGNLLLTVTNPTSNWTGLTFDFDGILERNAIYIVEFKVRCSKALSGNFGFVMQSGGYTGNGSTPQSRSITLVANQWFTGSYEFTIASSGTEPGRMLFPYGSCVNGDTFEYEYIKLYKKGGSAYSWEGSYTWDSPEATRTWEKAYSNISTVAVTETLAISEKLTKNTNTTKFETLAITERIFKQATKINKEALNIAEAYTDLISFLLRVMEALNITETPKKTVIIPKSETINIAEKPLKNAGLNKYETFSIVDSNNKAFTALKKENLGIAELAKKNAIINKSETLNFIEQQFKDFGLNKFETIAIAEGVNKIIDLLRRENMTITEFAKRDIGLKKNENLIVAETKQAKSVTKVNNETINIAEMYTDLIAFLLRVYEAINIEEVPKKVVSIKKIETFTIAETKQAKTVKKVNNENLSVVDSAIKSFGTLQKESLNVTDTTIKDVSIKKSETITVAEKLKKLPTKLSKENIAISETLKRPVAWQRLFQETVALTDKIAKNCSITKREALQIVEAYLRNANSVLSDIVISSNDMTLEQFINEDTPLGYEQFKDFIAGDIEYQKALIRMIVEAGVTSDSPNVNHWEMNLDLPDVIDRGQANISAQIVRINFNRTFFAPPEVTVTLKGGSVAGAVPKVTTIDELGFNVKIENAAGTMVTGVISWNAVGY